MKTITNFSIIKLSLVLDLVKRVLASRVIKRKNPIDIESEIKATASVDYSKLTPAEIKKVLRDAFCTNHTAKMRGVWSISTSCLLNARCLSRMLDNTAICSKCFSASMNGQYDALRVKLMRNTFLLNSVDLTADMIPPIGCKSKMFRFESFGDLLTPLQVKNYFTIASVAGERGVKCALWTKNPDIINKAFEKYGLVKPANLQIIQSTLARVTANKVIHIDSKKT